MAQATAAAAMPPTDSTDDADPADEAGAPETDDDSGDDDDQPTVLLTVMDNHDGTYTLIQGDEDQDEDEVGAAGDADEDAGGAPDDTDMGAGSAGADEGAAGAAAGPGEGEPQGQTFDSPGALLKGILDILKGGDTGSGEDSFQAGFTGGAAASPARGTPGAAMGGAPMPAMPQKY